MPIRADGNPQNPKSRWRHALDRLWHRPQHAAPTHPDFPPAWELGKSRVLTVWTSDDCCCSCDPADFSDVRMNLRKQKLVINYIGIEIKVTGPAVAGLHAAFTESNVGFRQ
jgi:hypothetical protein